VQQTNGVFFDHATKMWLDAVMIHDDGVMRGKYGGKTLEEYQFDHEGPVEVLDWEEATAIHRSKYLTPPKQVTQERFWEMLEVLPPCKWNHSKSAESFFVSERITLDLVSWFVRLGDEYWELIASDKLNHDDVVNLVLGETK